MVRFHSAPVYYSFQRFSTLPILSFLTPDSNMMKRAATEMDYTYFPLSLPKETRHNKKGRQKPIAASAVQAPGGGKRKYSGTAAPQEDEREGEIHNRLLQEVQPQGQLGRHLGQDREIRLPHLLFNVPPNPEKADGYEQGKVSLAPKTFHIIC